MSSEGSNLSSFAEEELSRQLVVEEAVVEESSADEEAVAEEAAIETEVEEAVVNEESAEEVAVHDKKPSTQRSEYAEEEDFVDARDECPQDESVDDEERVMEENPETQVTQTNIDASEIGDAADLSTPVPLVTSPSYITVATTSVSNKLAAMMLDRIKAIDNIRHLLETERENDSAIIAEFTDKVAVMEHEIFSNEEIIASLNKNVGDLKTKNGDYAQQLICLTTTINELVDSNNVNIQQIVVLEQVVAVKKGAIEKMTEEIQCKQLTLDENAKETTALAQQLEAFKTENSNLKATIEDLEVKNSDLAGELEKFLSSLQELVEQNSALENQVEDLINANKEQYEINDSVEQKNSELLDAVEALTESLNEARSCHMRDTDQLQRENEALKKQMKMEEENNAVTINQLEQILEDTTAQMTDQMSAQKNSFEEQLTDLMKSLDESNTSRKKAVAKNSKLQTAIEDVKGSASESAENTAATIGQLEKDLEEEFQIATQLKRGMEDLKKKMNMEENEDSADELEDLLDNLRKIQCWQLSHFQRINKLVTENKEQSRSIQLL